MRKLKLGLVAVAMVAVLGAPVHALGCEGVALDDGCLFTITGGDTPDLDDGYAVTNAAGVPLWDFVREREAQAIGYPISQRWTEGPFTLQAFQKVILQWDPGKQRVNYYNTLDALADRYPWVQLPFVPAHQVLEEDRGASFGTIIRNHLALLDQNEAIKERFLSEPDWLNLYGLPIRYEEREVDGDPAGVQLLRTQRTVFVVWNVPAAGVTVGRVNLQNVPDKLKKLSNVVIPDAARILAHAPDPGLNPAIRRLSWVADGITVAEQETVLLLRKLYSSSQELFWRLVFELRVPWIHDPPDPQTEAALGILLAIADISWTRRHIEPAEPGLLGMLLHAPEAQWPPPFHALLQKPWMRDGVTWNELTFTSSLLTLALRYGSGPVDANPHNYRLVNEFLESMLAMPFLRTFEGYEGAIFQRLGHLSTTVARPGRNQPHFVGHGDAVAILQSFARNGGISDEQALLYILGAPDRSDTEPERFAETLAQWHQDTEVQERTVFQVRSGNIHSIVVHQREHSISPHVFATVHEVLNQVVDFMQVRFPHSHLILEIETLHSGVQGIHQHDYAKIDSRYTEPGSVSSETRRILAHLIARYYWPSYPAWLSDGATTLVEYGLGYRDPDLPPEVNSPEVSRDLPGICPFDSIDEITEGYMSACQLHLGTRMFLDLYRSLDESTFHHGFAQLFNELYGGFALACFETPLLNIPCIAPEKTPHVDVVTEAFTADATPEGAAIARAVIGRWYYGDPGALQPPDS